MPFPVAMVGIIGVGGAAAVIAVAAHDDHSAHSDHTDYSDAAERRKREEEARERERRKNLELARKDMNSTLMLVRSAMADVAGGEAEKIFRQWNFDENNFSYKDFATEFAKLDKRAKDNIAKAVSLKFDKVEKEHNESLHNINILIQKITERRLTEK